MIFSYLDRNRENIYNRSLLICGVELTQEMDFSCDMSALGLAVAGFGKASKLNQISSGYSTMCVIHKVGVFGIQWLTTVKCSGKNSFRAFWHPMQQGTLSRAHIN